MRKRRWNRDKVISSIFTFVDETGYFPKTEDFNNCPILPPYSVMYRLGIKKEVISYKHKFDNDEFVPVMKYPSRFSFLYREYLNMTGNELLYKIINHFYVFKILDDIEVSFFDTPIFLAHYERYKSVKDIMYIDPNKWDDVLKLVGLVWKNECKKIEKKDELLDTIMEAMQDIYY